MAEFKDRDRRHIYALRSELEQPKAADLPPRSSWQEILANWLIGLAGEAPAVRDNRPSTAHIADVSPQLTESLATWLRGRASAEDRQVVTRDAVFARCRRSGLREILDLVADRPALRAATINAADPAVAPPLRLSRAGTPEPAGTALWRASERRAATLYRRAVDNHELDESAQAPAVQEALARIGSGQPLPVEIRRRLEPEFGLSFARVRVHTDAVAIDAAKAINAEAFTIGEDIFFGAGSFDPSSTKGQKLIAHELQHVVQAWSGRTRSLGRAEVSRPDDPLEQEAEATSVRVASREQPHEAPRPAPAVRSHAPSSIGLAMQVFRAPKPTETPANPVLDATQKNAKPTAAKSSDPKQAPPRTNTATSTPVQSVAQTPAKTKPIESADHHESNPAVPTTSSPTAQSPQIDTAVSSSSPVSAGGSAVSGARAREAARITAAFDAMEADVRRTSAAEQAKVHGAGSSKATELASTLDQRIATGRSVFGTARANLTTAARTQAALARSDAHDAAKRLGESSEHLRGEAIQKAAAEGDQVMAAAREAGASIAKSATKTGALVKTLMHAGFSIVDAKLRGSDHDAVHAALKDAAEAISGKLQDQALADAHELVAQASRHTTALINEAGDLFDEANAAKTNELCEAMTSGGETLAHQIESRAEHSLGELARTEQQYFAKLSRLKAGTGSLIESSTQMAIRVDAAASAQVAGLRLAKGSALAALETTASAAGDQIRAHQPSRTQLKTVEQVISQELAKLATALIAQANAASSGHTSLAGTAERFRAAAGDQAGKLVGSLDRAESSLAKSAAEAATRLTGQGAATRALALGAYNDALVHQTAPSGNKLRDATAHWKEQTKAFRANAQKIVTTGLEQHVKLATELPDALQRVAIQALADNHPSLVNSIAHGLLGLAEGIVVGAILVGLVWLATPLTVVGAGIAVAVGFVGLAFKKRIEVLSQQWDGLSTGDKAGGVFVSLLASIPDAFGATSLQEAITKTDSFTGKALNPREVQDRYVSGAIQTIASAFMVKAMVKGVKKPPLPGEGNLPGADLGKAVKPTETKATKIKDETDSATTKQPEAAKQPGSASNNESDVPPSKSTGSEPTTHPENKPPVGAKSDKTADNGTHNNTDKSPTGTTSSERAVEILRRHGNSVRTSLEELNQQGFSQKEMVEALTAMFRASGRDVGNVVYLPDGTAVLASRVPGVNSNVNIISKGGIAEFGHATLKLNKDLTRPFEISNVRGSDGRVISADDGPAQAPSPETSNTGAAQHPRTERQAPSPDGSNSSEGAREPSKKSGTNAELSHPAKSQETGSGIKAAAPIVPHNVDAVSASIKQSGQLSGDLSVFEGVVRRSKGGDPGALGELEAVQRWVNEGRNVEVLSEKQNAGVKNPDYRVDGKVREVKTRHEQLNDRWIKDQIANASKQVKRSGLKDQKSGEHEMGEAELQLRGEAGDVRLEDVEQQVRGAMTNRNRSIGTVRVYNSGTMMGEWFRDGDLIVRRFPK